MKRRRNLGSIYCLRFAGVGILAALFMFPIVAAAGTFQLPGSLNVSASGAATYSIPIDIPPGTAGMAPELSLNYNSQGGDGMLGVGWSLSGLSTITRCPSTIAQDGANGRLFGLTGAVNNDANDRLCLDGQRMMVLAGATYGSDGAEYRLENDNFTKVVASGAINGSGSYFTAYTRSGRILEYGRVGISANSKVLVDGTGVGITWALDKVTDQSGNYYTIAYRLNPADNQLYPTSINYSGNGALQPYNTVTFGYSAVATHSLREYYQAGARVVGRLNLTSIYTDVGTRADPASGTTVSHYMLSYATSEGSQREELTSVQKCDGSPTSPTCLPATTFTWAPAAADAGSFTDTAAQTAPCTGKDVGEQVFYADFNGDGLTDQICIMLPGNVPVQTAAQVNVSFATPATDTSPAMLTQGSWSTLSSCLTGPVLEGDFDGDGKTDLICVDHGGSSEVYLSKGDGTFRVAQAVSALTNCVGTIAVGDFDGDGREDLICEGANQTVALSNNQWATGNGGFYAEDASALSQCASIIPDTGDFNGDGKLDLICSPSKGTFYVALSKGDGNFAMNAQSFAFCGGASEGPNFGDFNGDGKTDMECDLPGTQGGDNHVVAFSNGDGTFTKAVQWPDPDSSWCIETVQLGDFNGDGRTDLACIPSNGNVHVALSDGTGQFVTQGEALSAWCPADANSLSIADIDGDGSSDLVCLKSASSKNVIAFAKGAPDTVTQFTAGLGTFSKVEYTPITTGGLLYQHRARAEVPSGPIYVVWNTHKDTGVKDTGGAEIAYTQYYSYEGAQSNLAGRGFQGFASISYHDLCLNAPAGSTHMVVTTNYNQDWPLTGTVKSQTKKNYPDGTCVGLGTGTTVNTVVNTYTSTPTRGGAQFVHLDENKQWNWDLNGSPGAVITTDYTYDTYGNATETSINSNEGYSSDTCNTYTNDITDWVLGELTQTQTTGNAAGAGNNCTNTPVRTTKYFYAVTPGLISAMTVEPDSATDYVRTDYTRDRYGNPLSISVVAVDPVTGNNMAPRTTTYTYDGYGRFPTEVSNPLLQATTLEYDPSFGGLDSSTDPNNVKTTWTYDTLGRKQTEQVTNKQQQSLPITTWHYPASCSAACSIGVTRPGAPATYTYFDRLERPVYSTAGSFDGGAANGSGSTVYQNQTTYDPLGRVSSVARPYLDNDTQIATVTYSYDDLGRVTEQNNPDGGKIQHSYSDGTSYYTAMKTTVSGADIASRSSWTVTNSLGQTLSVTDAYNNKTSYAYDAFGNLTNVTDPAGNEVNRTYSIRGHLLSSNDADSGTTSFVSNGLGELRIRTDNRQDTVTMLYDKLGRMTQQRFTSHDGTAQNWLHKWSYDVADGSTSCSDSFSCGQLVQATTEGAYERDENYDAFGRNFRTTIVPGNGIAARTTTTHFDGFGRVSSTTYPSQFVASYVYNDQNYLSAVTNGDDGPSIWKATARDASFNVTHETFGSNKAVTTRTFNWKSGRLTDTETDLPATGTRVQHYIYSWDVAGNLATRQDYGYGFETFSYDKLDRLTKVDFSGGFDNPDGTNDIVNKTYAYDAIGNITCKSELSPCSAASPNYTYGSLKPHAVTGITGTANDGSGPTGVVTDPTYTYDVNGRMKSGADANGNGRSFTYAGFDAPVTVTNQAGTTTFQFDSENQRVIQSAPEGTTYYIRAQGVLTEYYLPKATDQDPTPSQSWRSYVMVEGRMVDVVQSPGSGAPNLYLHSDHLGSITADSDDQGNWTHYSFDAWGKRRRTDGHQSNSIAANNNHGYTGQEELADSALVHLNARVYDPEIGKFTAGDPLPGAPAGKGDWNRYAYVGNNPLNRTDPTGEITLCTTSSNPFYEVGRNEITIGAVQTTTCTEISNVSGPSSVDLSKILPTIENIDVYGKKKKAVTWKFAGLADLSQPLSQSGAFGYALQSTPCDSAGSAPAPSSYAARGQGVVNARSGAQSDPYGSGGANIGAALLDFANLFQFHRGGTLDAQVLYGGSPAYANYAFGVYMSAAGYSLPDSLGVANTYGSLFSRYPASTVMDPNYSSIPASNVTNVTSGHNDQSNGSTCHVH
jgi:RHS repeat-associated protein